jgi:hypothetical protein
MILNYGIKRHDKHINHLKIKFINMEQRIIKIANFNRFDTMPFKIFETLYSVIIAPMLFNI